MTRPPYTVGEALACGGRQLIGERRGARGARQQTGQEMRDDLGRELSAEVDQAGRVQRRHGRGRVADLLGTRRVCAQVRR